MAAAPMSTAAAKQAGKIFAAFLTGKFPYRSSMPANAQSRDLFDCRIAQMPRGALTGIGA